MLVHTQDLTDMESEFGIAFVIAARLWKFGQVLYSPELHFLADAIEMKLSSPTPRQHMDMQATREEAVFIRAGARCGSAVRIKIT